MILATSFAYKRERLITAEHDVRHSHSLLAFGPVHGVRRSSSLRHPTLVIILDSLPKQHEGQDRCDQENGKLSIERLHDPKGHTQGGNPGPDPEENDHKPPQCQFSQHHYEADDKPQELGTFYADHPFNTL